ncbi:hypothetical protein FACS1894214_3070 [Planctomycetales bacterium]|nr:hypothetical protein FACS1894214_3020 [Planctomycetales bacterium]GHT31608.1 hypothetical protein FACS1894214_3070 [Planctomycetales bacterium]
MSMAPTLIAPSKNYSDDSKISDRVIANKMIYRWSFPQRGDIAAYRTTTIDGEPVVFGQRIVGLPGETVDIQSPDILINGKRLTEPPFFKTMSEKDDGYGGYVRLEEIGWENAGVLLPITLGQDEYFLLGDNSEQSLDSRVKGAVHRKDIIGKVVRLYYPFSRLRDL